jgi:hypothetical protein
LHGWVGALLKFVLSVPRLDLAHVLFDLLVILLYSFVLSFLFNLDLVRFDDVDSVCDLVQDTSIPPDIL